MHRSRNSNGNLLPEYRALQHERQNTRAPRPLPLFLELVRDVSARNPELAREALEGLRAYERAPVHRARTIMPEVARLEGATLRDHGGSGPPCVLIPSLINPPRILDLDEEVSLAQAIARTGRRSLLLDWGKADERKALSVSAHVEELMIPLLGKIGRPVALIGYCLGGTMAIAASNLVNVERLATIATPWNFANYPQASKSALFDMWNQSKAAAKQLGALPMEVLQAAFWSLDPEQTVRKFAQFGTLEPSSAKARRFVELEEWANDGEPLPYPAAEELIEDLFVRDTPGSGIWMMQGRRMSDDLDIPRLHLTAEYDRIAPRSTAPRGATIEIHSGHVGMIVGSSRNRLQSALKTFLSTPLIKPD